jgi:gas vesicle protein
MDKRSGRFAFAAVVAAAAGYVAGILTAPKSGKETRKDIKDAANAKRAEIEKQLKKAHTELSDHLTKASKQVATLKGKTKAEAEKAVKQATKAKDKARVALSSIRDGEAEDSDLQKAITDADRAIEHLKQYIIKK